MSAAVEMFGIVKTVLNMLKGKTELKGSKYALMAGPFLMAVALAVYTGFEGPVPDQDYAWGWSYILGWVTSIITPIYGIIVIRITWFHERDEYDIETPMIP